MSNLFLLLFLVSFICLVVGFIAPNVFSRFFKGKSTRKKIALVFGLTTFVFFILVGATADTQTTNPTASQQVADNTIVTPPADTKAEAVAEPVTPKSDEDIITEAIVREMPGNNNLDKKKLKGVTVTAIEGGGYDVQVAFNADDNITANMRKKSVFIDMSKLYWVIYKNTGKDIRTAKIGAYFPMTDKYGNTADEIVYATGLNKDVADKVNWDINEATLQLTILPGVWTTLRDIL